MKITKQQLKRLIKEELEEFEMPKPRMDCGACIEDINKDLRAQGYQIIVLESFPVQYRLERV